jgi:hypothetical protein
MPGKYKQSEFNNDLMELTKLINGLGGGGKGEKRSFKLVQVDGKTVNKGRYNADSPLTAARRAYSVLCREASGDKCTYKFMLKETTRGSNKKVYGPYLGSRKKRAKPLTVMIAGKKITYKFDSSVKSLKDQKGGKKYKYVSK